MPDLVPREIQKTGKLLIYYKSRRQVVCVVLVQVGWLALCVMLLDRKFTSFHPSWQWLLLLPVMEPLEA